MAKRTQAPLPTPKEMEATLQALSCEVDVAIRVHLKVEEKHLYGHRAESRPHMVYTLRVEDNEATPFTFREELDSADIARARKTPEAIQLHAVASTLARPYEHITTSLRGYLAASGHYRKILRLQVEDSWAQLDQREARSRIDRQRRAAQEDAFEELIRPFAWDLYAVREDQVTLKAQDAVIRDLPERKQHKAFRKASDELHNIFECSYHGSWGDGKTEVRVDDGDIRLTLPTEELKRLQENGTLVVVYEDLKYRIKQARGRVEENTATLNSLIALLPPEGT